MGFRWKDAKFGQNGIGQFFSPQPSHRHTVSVVRAKISRKTAFFSKSHKNAVIRIFWHVEFISALKTELNSTVFEKNANNEIKYLIIVIFYFFVIFSKRYQHNCIKTMESWFLDGKTPNSAEMVLINFLAHSLHIAILQ